MGALKSLGVKKATVAKGDAAHMRTAAVLHAALAELKEGGQPVPDKVAVRRILPKWVKLFGLDAPAGYDPAEDTLVVDPYSALWKSPRKLKKMSEKQHKQGFWSVPDANGTLVHEAGHALHYKTGYFKNPDEFLEAAQATSLSPDETRLVGLEVSEYGSTAPAELVAEVYTGLFYGKQYSPEVMALYEKYGGPPVRKTKGR